MHIPVNTVYVYIQDIQYIYIYIYVAVFSIYSYFPPLHILVGHGSTGMRILMAPVSVCPAALSASSW